MMSGKPKFNDSDDWGRQLSSLRRNWTQEEIVAAASVDHLAPLWYWLQSWSEAITSELMARAKRAESERKRGT